MGVASRVLLVFWELPQNLLGLGLLGIQRTLGGVKGTEWDSERFFIETRFTAVSLGTFVFWARGATRWARFDEWTRAHEFGHTFQSRWLGPLYLPCVGVPSVMRVVYAILYREATGRRWTHYFDGYPENWADRLGGVPAGVREGEGQHRSDV